MTLDDTSHLDALEAAAFQSWPAIDEAEQHGWRLRWHHGYTKRANSANAGGQAAVLGIDDLRAIEARYRERGLPPIFRIPSFAPVATVDTLLAVRGYRFVDLSWVMARPRAPLADAPEPRLLTDVDDWLARFQDISGKTGADQRRHRELLRAIRAPSAFAVLEEDGEASCCGLGVLVDGRLGLFDIATRAAHRRQGLARRLCLGLMHWGARQGATSSYLQVDATNRPAIRLYEALGFERRYHYWYRVGH